MSSRWVLGFCLTLTFITSSFASQVTVQLSDPQAVAHLRNLSKGDIVLNLDALRSAFVACDDHQGTNLQPARFSFKIDDAGALAEFRQLENGSIRVHFPALKKAFSLKAPADQLSVNDYFNLHFVTGNVAKFMRKMAKLSKSGNPHADDFFTYGLVNKSDEEDQFDFEGKLLALLDKPQPFTLRGRAHLIHHQFFMCYAHLRDSVIAAQNYLHEGDEDSAFFVSFFGLKKGNPEYASVLADIHVNWNGYTDTLMWRLVSFRDITAMDTMRGFASILNFIDSHRADFGKGGVSLALNAANDWFDTNPGTTKEAFQRMRDWHQPLDGRDLRSIEHKDESVQALFWAHYATGDYETFYKLIAPAATGGNANAIFMMSYKYKGFGGERKVKVYRALLSMAAQKGQPMAKYMLAIEHLLDGVLHRNDWNFIEARKLLVELYQNKKRYGMEVVADAIALLGFMEEKQYGPKTFYKPDQLYNEAFLYSALAVGCAAKQELNTVKRFAYLTMAVPTLTEGDWLNGATDWMAKVKTLPQGDQEKAVKLANETLATHPHIRWNVYQKIAAGLKPEFSSIK